MTPKKATLYFANYGKQLMLVKNCINTSVDPFTTAYIYLT